MQRAVQFGDRRLVLNNSVHIADKGNQQAIQEGADFPFLLFRSDEYIFHTVTVYRLPAALWLR